MIMAHIKPSDGIIKEIEQAVNCYMCKGDLKAYGETRFEICTKICKENGIENPTHEDLVGSIPAFNYHAQKFIDLYLQRKYSDNYDRTEQEATGSCTESC